MVRGKERGWSEESDREKRKRRVRGKRVEEKEIGWFEESGSRKRKRRVRGKERGWLEESGRKKKTEISRMLAGRGKKEEKG